MISILQCHQTKRFLVAYSQNDEIGWGTWWVDEGGGKGSLGSGVEHQIWVFWDKPFSQRNT